MRRASFRIAGFLTAVLLTVLMASTASASVTLPGGLTAIETEAFMGDRAMTGLVRIPAGVNTVREDAFTDTGVFAMELPATVRTVETQRLSGLTYMRIESRSADLVSLPDTLKYIASPKGGLVQYYANFHHVDFYPIDTLIADGGFYYVPNDTGLTLLSAVDNSAVPASVMIPENVDGQWVNAVSAYAFAGCPQVTSIALPVAAEGHVPASATADCSSARVSYYGNGPLVIKSVKASNEEPLVGETVTFTVEVEGGTAPYSLSYTVSKDGETVTTATEKNSALVFSHAFTDAAVYTVDVEIKDKNNYKAESACLLSVYTEEPDFIIPETLQGGEDLIITKLPSKHDPWFKEIKNTRTGETVITIQELVTIGADVIKDNSYVVPGFILSSNETYSVILSYVDNAGVEQSLMKQFSVRGEKPKKPDVSPDRTTVYGDGTDERWFYVEILNDYNDIEKVAIKIYDENSQAIYVEEYNSNEFNINIVRTSNIQISVYSNHKWSLWSDVFAVDYVIPEKPLVAIIDERIYAGQSFSILIGEMENAEGYDVSVIDTNSRYSEEVYWSHLDHSGVHRLDEIAPYLHTGPYRLRVSVYINNTWIYTNIDFIVEDQIRPEKPMLRLQLPMEATPTDLNNVSSISDELYIDGYETAMLVIPTDVGIEQIVVRGDGFSYYKPNGRITRIAKNRLYPKQTIYYSVAIRSNGVWSEWSNTTKVIVGEQHVLGDIALLSKTTFTAGENIPIETNVVENADQIWCSIETLNEQEHYWTSGQDKINGVCKGYKLEDGLDYRIKIQAYNGQYEAWETKYYNLTMSGSRKPDQSVVLSSESESVSQGQPAKLYIDAPNAEQVAIRYSNQGIVVWMTDVACENGKVDYTVTLNKNLPAGTIMDFDVSTYKNGVWSEWSKPIQVRIEEKQEEWTSDNGITIICPWGLGGGADSTIRAMAPLLQQKLGIPVDVRNETGNSGVNGATYAYNKPADGNTFLLGTQSLYIQDMLGNMDFNFKDEFECEDILVHSINILAGSWKAVEKYGFNTYSELKAYAVNHPYEVSIAMLTTRNVDGMCFEQATDGIPFNPVTYDSGSASYSDLAGGHLDLAIGNYVDMSDLIKSGDIIPLLVFCEHRVNILPDCECSAEVGVDCYGGAWRAIFAKKGTPQKAIDTLISAIEECREESSWKEYIRNTGYDQRSVPTPGSGTSNFCWQEYKNLRDYLYKENALNKDYIDLQ